MAKTRSNPGTPSIGTSVAVDRDYDPGQPGKHKDIRETSESEPLMQDHLQKNLEVANAIAKRWQDKQKKEGKKMWFNPLSAPHARKLHATKAEAQKEIDRDFKMQAEEKRLTKRPEAEYTPQQMLVPPKRTLADYLPPGYERYGQGTTAAANEVQKLGRLAVAASGRKLTAGTLVGMLESQAITRIRELDDSELKQAVHKSQFNGKRRLYKALVSEATRRQIAA